MLLAGSMAQEANDADCIARPRQLVRLKRKRTASFGTKHGRTDSTGRTDSSSPSLSVSAEPPSLENQHRRRDSKNRNPFVANTCTKSPPPKRLSCDSVGNLDTFWKLKSAGKNGTPETTECKEATAGSIEKCLFEDKVLFQEKDKAQQTPLCKAITVGSDPPRSFPEYPADWSLKTRLLFTSPLSLLWAGQAKAQEEAAGLSQSCRAQFTSTAHHQHDSERRCALQRCLVYWQQPSLPWLSLFPRINAEKNFSGKLSPWAQCDELRQVLMREWSISLSSLYSLLKSELCPYFYVCSYQFTVLFRAAGLAGSGCMTALISPTTKGLREAMRTEGIEFSLPLGKKKGKNAVQPEEPEEMEDKNQENGTKCVNSNEDDERQVIHEEEDEDDDSSWLMEIGLQDKIKKINGISIQAQKDDDSSSLDRKPDSVVCVEGSHTFNLINFLINCKSIVAAAGSQTGLPPTLLAPTAFRGATMKMLKVRSVNVKNQVGSVYQNVSSLEITGPILPSSLHAITTLLRTSQEGKVSATLYTHTPTAVFNVNTSPQQCDSAAVKLTEFGLPASSVHQLCQTPVLGNTALTNISINNHSYAWKTQDGRSTEAGSL